MAVLYDDHINIQQFSNSAKSATLNGIFSSAGEMFSYCSTENFRCCFVDLEY
jgi:hypothetical protein